MIGQLILAPFGIAYILGAKFIPLLLLPLTAVVLNVLAEDVLVDAVLVVVALTLTMTTVIMWVYMMMHFNLELSMVSNPWCFAVFGEEAPGESERLDSVSEAGVERSAPSSASMGSTAMQLFDFCSDDEVEHNKNLCPYTGEPGAVQCTGCRAFVSRSVFHRPSPRVARVPLGNHVTSYANVQVAMSFVQDPLVGRVLTDQALDFKCNLLFGSVGPCCPGCFVSNRCWNTLPRLILTCMVLSVMAAAAPYAVEDAGDFPEWARALLGALSLFFGGAAPLVLADCAATSVAFLRRYPALPYPEDGARPADLRAMPALARAIVALGANRVAKAL